MKILWLSILTLLLMWRVIDWGVDLYRIDFPVHHDFKALCPESQPVVVNGELVGCNNDVQSPNNTWIPAS